MDQYLMFIYGVVVILLMILMPMGIFGLGADVVKRIQKARLRNIRAERPSEE